MSKRRVVVTGIGVISPVGNNVKTAWENTCKGVSGIQTITKFDAATFTTTIAGEVKGFKAEDYFEVKEIKKLDVFSQYAVASAQEAIEDSGLLSNTTTPSYQPERIGCVLGVGLGGMYVFEKYHEAFLNGGLKKISPFMIPAMISNLAPGNVAIRYNLKGINYTTTSACTSGAHAIGESYRMIAHGLQDAMVTGGSESTISPIGIGGFCAMKALSTRNDDPTRASRPFDKDRDGFVMGEGGATLVLEDYETAKKRGAKIYAEVIGYGASCDAYHITSPCVDGAGAVASMKNALVDGGLNPTDIDYINAHGTSTEYNDRAESQAIKSVFGEHSVIGAKDGLVVSSTKSVTGHLLGAAGAIEGVFSVLAIQNGVVPPTMNFETPGEGCELDYVPNEAREKKVRRVMSNSFGFGGTNATVVFGAV